MADAATILNARRAGHVLVPVGFGLLLGFWGADRGMRLVPDAVAIAASTLLLGCLLLSYAFFNSKPRSRVKLRASVAGVVVSVLALGAAAWVARPSPLTSQDSGEFASNFAVDRQRYREHQQGMARIVERLREASIPPADDQAVLSADHEAILLDAWVAFRDYAMALDQIRRFYEDYYRFDISRHERGRHLQSFLLTFAAELALYDNAARLAAQIARNDNAKKYLDAPHPDRHLPSGSFSLMRQQLLGARDQARVIAGERYLDSLRLTIDAQRLAVELGVSPMWRRIDQSLAAIDALGVLDRSETTVRADLQGLKRGLKRAWYPVQKGAAEALGDTRVRRIGNYLIDQPLREKVDALLMPGDVLIARKNWYLSNLGLPGFWPHAILYLGTPEKLARHFDDDEAVRAWVSQQTAAAEGDQAAGAATREPRFSRWLERRFASAWRAYGRSDHGEPRRVIEAVSEGVVFSTLGYCAGDYLAALRPRLDKLAKAQAIAAAFSQVGRPYDFDFDFATDHAIVCTELVWRAYRPAKGKSGFDMPLVSVAGRMTLPANHFAATYAVQHGSDSRLFDFIAFVDASEKEQRAFLSTEESFRQTHVRPKWDVAQE